jgi:HK97 family phage portal protein
MTFVVTSGQMQAVNRAPEYNITPWAGRSVTLSPTLSLTYEALWRAQPALRTVTGFLARNVAQLSVDPYLRTSSTDREKAVEHPIARLLERPVPGSKWTKYRLLNTLMHDLCIFDCAYWLKVKTRGGEFGILPVPPRFIAPRGTDLFAPESYRLRGNQGFKDIGPDQVVHFHGYNPDDPREGTAPIETLRQILAEEHSASVYREQLWRNGARVAGYLRRPKDAPDWSPDARNRFRAEWNAQYTGDSPAAGGTPLLEDGMAFEGAGVTPREAQYVEARKLTREEVAVAYHVPPVMLGLMQGVNFGSVRELHRMLYQDTLPPWLMQISQDIECQLLEDLDPQGARTGTVYVEFNLKGKLQGSFEEQAKSFQSAVGGPYMTRSEARAMNNLPHIDGADDLIVPLNVTTGGLASPNATAPNEPDNEASNGKVDRAVLSRFLARRSKGVMSKYGAGIREPAALMDIETWAGELAADLGGTEGAHQVAGGLIGYLYGALSATLRAEQPPSKGQVLRVFSGECVDPYVDRFEAKVGTE